MKHPTIFCLKLALFIPVTFNILFGELCSLYCDSVTLLTELEFTEFMINQDHKVLQTKVANLLWNVASSHLKSVFALKT